MSPVPGPWWPDVQSLHHRPGAQSNGCPLKSIQSRFEGQKRVSSRAVTEACLLVAVPASIVFPPPGASEENGPPHSSTRTQLPQSMKIMHEIMYKLEVLYVLCVLLMGRQRNQVRPAQLRAAALARCFPRMRAARRRPARLPPQRLWPWPSSARSRVPQPCSLVPEPIVLPPHRTGATFLDRALGPQAEVGDVAMLPVTRPC